APDETDSLGSVPLMASLGRLALRCSSSAFVGCSTSPRTTEIPVVSVATANSPRHASARRVALRCERLLRTISTLAFSVCLFRNGLPMTTDGHRTAWADLRRL